MDLWATLGVSPQAGLAVAVAGVLAAVALAGTLMFRRARVEKHPFDLGQPR
jgi:hypothetical protein